MAYIEKEPIIKFITKGLNNPDKTKAFGYDAIEILTEIEYSPTADVVPRAEVDELAKQHHDLIVEKDRLFDEVERLQHILDSYALQYGTVKDQQSVIVKVKSETLSEFLRMVENVCKYEERLSYEKIKDGIKRQIAMKGGAE